MVYAKANLSVNNFSWVITHWPGTVEGKTGPERWRAKLKICKSSLPTSHPLLHSHDQACPVDYGPRPLKFRTNDCTSAAQAFCHLAHGARILRSQLIILVSAGFQPNATQQDYPLDQHELKSLKVVTGLKWKKRNTCSTVLNLEAGRWPAQRLRAHATWPFKDGPKQSEGFLNIFLVISVQTKLSFQSSEFLLTKDREIADNVHCAPRAVKCRFRWRMILCLVYAKQFRFFVIVLSCSYTFSLKLTWMHI